MQKNIFTDENTRQRFSKDASIFSILPKEVFIPENSEELKSFIKEKILEKKSNPELELSFTARSAGTCMSGGPLSKGTIISYTENLNKLISFDILNKKIKVEPGMFYRDFEKITEKENLIMPSYPASKNLCAIGGMIANNSAGEKTLKYGKTSHFVEEIEMICSDGNVYNFKEFKGEDLNNLLKNDNSFFGDLHRKVFDLIKENDEVIKNNTPKVSKNSSGYALWDVYDEQNHSMNLAKLIVGSQGTFGLITSSTFKLVPLENKNKMAVIFLKDIKVMPKVVEKILPLMPESFEIFDDHTFKIAMKFLPHIIKRLGGSLFSLGLLFLPELKMILTGSIPKVVMLIEFVEKDKEAIKNKIEKLQEILKEFSADNSLNKFIQSHIVQSEKEEEKYWVFRRESFNLLRSKLKGVRTAPFIEDVVVQAKDLANFLPEFEKILDEEKVVYTIAGHVADGNVHVIPLMKLKEEKTIEQLERISNSVYSLVQKYSGSLSGEHNDGLIRSPFLHYMFSEEMLKLFTKTKNIFDPENIFNPGKKINVTWQEAKKFIDRNV